jgi:hypothetical protein
VPSNQNPSRPTPRNRPRSPPLLLWKRSAAGRVRVTAPHSPSTPAPRRGTHKPAQWQRPGCAMALGEASVGFVGRRVKSRPDTSLVRNPELSSSCSMSTCCNYFKVGFVKPTFAVGRLRLGQCSCTQSPADSSARLKASQPFPATAAPRLAAIGSASAPAPVAC